MSVLLGVWLIGSAVVAATSLLVGLCGIPATAGYRSRGEARFILACLALVPTSPLWPLLFPAGLVYACAGLWSDADLDTLSRWRERRRVSVAVERDRRVREQAKRIADLEREAGIR